MIRYFLTTLVVFFCFTNLYGQNNSCVFNDNYESLSLQTAQHLTNIISVSWSNVDSLANIVGQNDDMLELRVGGCYHFGYNLTIKTNQSFDKPEDILKKIGVYLTNKVDISIYEILIFSKQKGLKFSEINESFTMINLDYETEIYPENLVLHPIVISTQNIKTIINLSWYYN